MFLFCSYRKPLMYGSISTDRRKTTAELIVVGLVMHVGSFLR